MQAKPRGIAVIINNKTFAFVRVSTPSTGVECTGTLTLILTPSQDRSGTDRDAESLEQLFAFLGFTVMRYNDLKSRDMRRTLQVRTTESTSSPLYWCPTPLCPAP